MTINVFSKGFIWVHSKIIFFYWNYFWCCDENQSKPTKNVFSAFPLLEYSPPLPFTIHWASGRIKFPSCAMRSGRLQVIVKFAKEIKKKYFWIPPNSKMRFEFWGRMFLELWQWNLIFFFEAFSAKVLEIYLIHNSFFFLNLIPRWSLSRSQENRIWTRYNKLCVHCTLKRPNVARYLYFIAG